MPSRLVRPPDRDCGSWDAASPALRTPQLRSVHPPAPGRRVPSSLREDRSLLRRSTRRQSGAALGASQSCRFPPPLRCSLFWTQQIMIELANRLDRPIQLLLIVQPATNLANALPPHPEFPPPSTPIGDRQNTHPVPFATRA